MINWKTMTPAELRQHVYQLLDQVQDAKVAVMRAEEAYRKVHDQLLGILSDTFPLRKDA